MKLKTLKDFKRSVGVDFAGEIINALLKEIKAEAVKWVKHGDYCLDWGKENYGIKLDDEKQNWRLWIINFFNITEEDLK